MFGIFKVINGVDRDRVFTVVPGETLTLGSGPGLKARLRGADVGGVHCRAVFEGGKMFLRDAGSYKGTMVNGRWIQESEVRAGDVVELGGVRLTFSWSREDERQTAGEIPNAFLSPGTR